MHPCRSGTNGGRVGAKVKGYGKTVENITAKESTTLTKPRVLFVVGIKNSGKTTLIEKLIGELSQRGYRVGTVKHHHSSSRLEVDREGKDSWRHRQAGAEAVALVSPSELAVIRDTDGRASFEKTIGFLADMDIVLVEGFSSEPGPRIEVGDMSEKNQALQERDPHLIARVSREKLPGEIPSFTLDETGPLVELIERCVLRCESWSDENPRNTNHTRL